MSAPPHVHHPDELGGYATNWPHLEAALQGPHELPRWMGWRLRLLVAWVLIGCAIIFMMGHWLIGQPKLPVTLTGTADGMVRIQAVDYPTLQRLEGQILTGIEWRPPTATPAQTFVVPIELLTLQRSSRWISDAATRERYLQERQQLTQLIDNQQNNHGFSVDLVFEHGPKETVLISPRGLVGLSPLFWVLSLLALMVYAVGAAVLLAGPQWRNLAFAVMALCHSIQLGLIAVSTSLDIFTPYPFLVWDGHLRALCDLLIAASMVAIAALHPRRIPNWRLYISGTMMAWLGLTLGLAYLPKDWHWWWVQSGCVGLCIASWAVMTAAHRATPHPFTLVMRRFTIITVATWVLLSLAIAMGMARADMQLNMTTFGVMTWYVFAASQLLLTPYLSRSKLILQEFSLLAASSTIAASLDLLFIAIFSLGQITSMTLSLFMAFGVYLSIRRWLMTRLPGRDPLTMERLFQRLYRIAREVERKPDALNGLLLQLMRELFDPLEVSVVPGSVVEASLRGNGSVLLMPLPQLGSPNAAPTQVLVLKHARKGQRLFTGEDTRLADRIAEQLHRALNFDHAVEQGRSEERLRIAQDLHDDIGARLLTLMYQAPTPDMEEYIRHTLQDLKTLTRGLAAQSHALTEAAGEWKRDITQRLGVARCELDWQMRVDVDVVLNMVQWSALTRILRELVNNTISHAKANKVTVCLVLENDRLTVTVCDNGKGSAPAGWSHGLGLGGVRKRVKQLGGSVRWTELQPQGICCEVVVEPFSASAGQPTEAQLSH